MALLNYQKITWSKHFSKSRNNSSQVFYKKSSEKFAKFTGKHLCWSLLLIQERIPALMFSSTFLQNFARQFFCRRPQETASTEDSLINLHAIGSFPKNDHNTDIFLAMIENFLNNFFFWNIYFPKCIFERYRTDVFTWGF